MCEHGDNFYIILPEPTRVSKRTDIHLRLLYCFALQSKFEHSWRKGLLHELIPGSSTNYCREVPVTRNPSTDTLL